MTKSKLTEQELLEIFNDTDNLNLLNENEKFKEIRECIVKSYNEELEKQGVIKIPSGFERLKAIEKCIILSYSEEFKKTGEELPELSTDDYRDLLIAIENQTPEICLAAVKHNGDLLSEVRHQTPEICLAAVKQHGEALRFVENQTPEICLAAVKQDGGALHYVKEQTPEICLAAVQQNGLALEIVKNQTLEICLAAIEQRRGKGIPLCVKEEFLADCKKHLKNLENNNLGKMSKF